MKNLVRIEILGREYNVKSDEGEERVKKIAGYVDKKFKEILEGTKTISTFNIAILAAFSIANDYFEVVEDQSTVSKAMEAKWGRIIERMIAMIDAQMVKG